MSWLLTFLVHSTLWCGLAWLVLALRTGLAPRTREWIWSTALAASLVTPSVQLASSNAAIWRIALPPVGSEREHSDRAATGRLRERGEHHGAPSASATRWSALALGAWLAGAAALLCVYGGRLRSLRRTLGQPVEVRDPAALRALARLSERAGLERPPRLTQSEALGSPIALGHGAGREICVPARALRELDEEQFRALLGHEVAHHLRRDPLRLCALNALRAVLFVQPLIRVAVRAIRVAAEEQCDDWSARELDDGLAMASCLAEVASWVVHDERAVPVPCMAQRRSPLRTRVDRLLDDGRNLDAPNRRPGVLGSAALIAIALGVAPAVTAAEEHERPRPGSEHRDDDAPSEHARRPRAEHR